MSNDSHKSRTSHVPAYAHIGVRNETLSVVAMRVSNKDCSPVAIHRRDPTSTPSGFAEIVSDDFPVLHRLSASLIIQNCLRNGLPQFKLCAYLLYAPQ